MNIENMLNTEMGISPRVYEIVKNAEGRAVEFYKKAEEVAEYNQLKVLNAFRKFRLSYSHFGETSGYGYDDLGRDTLDEVFADIFHAESAMVRHNIVSGTQAIALCLYAVLRPGDTLVSLVGSPYDTMEEVIGIRGEEGTGSLKDFGVNYDQVDLLPDGTVDYNGIAEILKMKKVKAVLIQRSKGYDWRKSLDVAEIGKIIKTVKGVSPDTVCIVDNCYGEFVEKVEPTDVGADLVVGSLIKNAGGSLAQSGGYVAGKEKYVELVGYRFTAPGLGKHVGASLGFNKSLYQGLFMAPHIVCQSIKTAILCACAFEDLGYDVCPKSDEVRTDIIQAIRLGKPEKVIKFCQGIQSGSPVDSHVSPVPWAMPGYEDEVIMAAGAFVQGASIELSADAPICEPYNVYMQGGIVYEASKLGIMEAVSRVIKEDE
ncbi:MAG: hypothetical protein E7415_05500 [Ruminococcaceae bacterium]|nr:hypothetical protein [Oscillospiraceae bacterium]